MLLGLFLVYPFDISACIRANKAIRPQGMSDTSGGFGSRSTDRGARIKAFLMRRVILGFPQQVSQSMPHDCRIVPSLDGLSVKAAFQQRQDLIPAVQQQV